MKNNYLIVILFLIIDSTQISSQSLTWLGTLGGEESIAYAVSDDGAVVVGKSKNSDEEDRAFIWKPVGGMQFLSGAMNIKGWARAVSTDGSVIVGTTQDDIGIRKAFKWTQATSLEYLTPLGGTPFNESEAFDLSSNGSKIVGRIQNLSNESRGFIWDENNGMTELSTLFYRGDYSIVNAISGNASLLVGWSSDTVNNFDQLPVEWESNYLINQMPTPGNSGNGVVEEISENGSYAVGRILIDGDMHGFRWHRQAPGYWETEVDIGFLSGVNNPQVCYALDVSNTGIVVGLTTGPSPDNIVAFLWERTNLNTDIMYNLNVLYSNLLNQSGYLLQANAISPDGRFIVGQGYRQSLDRYEAFLLDRGVSTSVNELNLFLDKYSLEQNYPNPFNPVTKIRYSIASTPLSLGDLPAGKAGGQGVRLIVYDVLGNEVATLVNEEKPAGVYEVEFNASQLSSGVYFYKLTSGSFNQSKKMIVLK